VWRGQRNESPRPLIFGFLDRSRYFSFKQLLSYPHEAEWTPYQIHYFSENLVELGIEPGTSGIVARNSDHETTELVSTVKPKVSHPHRNEMYVKSQRYILPLLHGKHFYGRLGNPNKVRRDDKNKTKYYWYYIVTCRPFAREGVTNTFP
jgi:hypothetical protein